VSGLRPHLVGRSLYFLGFPEGLGRCLVPPGARRSDVRFGAVLAPPDPPAECARSFAEE